MPGPIVTHWYIYAKGQTNPASNTFTADLVSLQVLVDNESLNE